MKAFDTPDLQATLARVKELDSDASVPRLVLDNGTRHGADVAMRRKLFGIWWPITWREVADNVARMAATILRGPTEAGDCILLIGDNDPELFWSQWAVQAARRVPVCLFADATADEARDVILHSGARTAFVEDQEQVDKLLSIDDPALTQITYWDARGMHTYTNDRLVDLADLLDQGKAVLEEEPALVADAVDSIDIGDLGVLIYTSGTSGEPKGVMGSHRYLLDCALRWGDLLGGFRGANYVSYISPAWATEQYLGLTLGPLLPMVINFPEDPDTVSQDIREIGAEFLFFSPRQWEMLVSSTEAKIRDAHWMVQRVFRWSLKALDRARHQNDPLSRLAGRLADWLVARPLRDRLGFVNLKAAVNSGAVLSPEIFERFDALGVSIRNVYGFTEVGIVSATRGERRFDSVGRPLESPLAGEPLEIRIQDDEIRIRGGVIFDGYFQRPDLTAEKTTPGGWFRSGDAGYFDDDGYLVYLDRLSDLRRLATGESFAPQYLETRLRLSPYIRDAMVVGDETREAVTALIDIDYDNVSRWAEEGALEFGTHADLSQIAEVRELIAEEVADVNESLPDASRIRAFVNLFKPLDPDEGELTRSRKIKRDVVESRYERLIAGLYDGSTEIDADIEIVLQDGRKRRVSATVILHRLEPPAEDVAEQVDAREVRPA